MCLSIICTYGLHIITLPQPSTELISLIRNTVVCNLLMSIFATNVIQKCPEGTSFHVIIISDCDKIGSIRIDIALTVPLSNYG